MMDGVRVRVFTLFGTITSVAAALYFWAPDVLIANIRLSALVELSIILVIIPSIIQNRLYHFWLFRAINISLHLENRIYSKIKKEGQKEQMMLTQSLTGLEERTECYWQAMWRSKLFGVEVVIFGFMILACSVLSYIFSF